MNAPSDTSKWQEKFEAFARKDGVTSDKVKSYAFTQAMKLVAIFKESNQVSERHPDYYPHLTVRQAIVAGIL